MYPISCKIAVKLLPQSYILKDYQKVKKYTIKLININISFITKIGKAVLHTYEIEI